MSKQINRNEFITTIDRFTTKGAGRAVVQERDRKGRMREVELSIPYTIPKEKVRVKRIPPFRKRVATLQKMIKPHANRMDPPCPHFSRCGGCTWQHIQYDAQLKYKTNIIKQLIEEQQLFDSTVVKDIIPAPANWHYRNKMEFTFGADGSLGLHELNNFRKVISLETCLIASEATVEIAKLVARWAKINNLKGYDKETHDGLLRNLLIRHSHTTDEIMVVFFATENKIDAVDELVKVMTSKFPQVKSILWMTNRHVADRIQAEEIELLYGREFIYDTMASYTYRLWFDTFFQTNPIQAEKLVEIAIDISQPKKTDRMIDLFCGVGTFSLPFADQVKRLAGIEIVEASILSARRNAADNEVTNTSFYTSDVRRGLAKVIAEFGRPNIFLLDPPRSGAGGKVMRRIARAEPERIVYISCNPYSFVRDIKELEPFGYQLQTVQPVDQFPQTYHVELVALMSRVDE